MYISLSLYIHIYIYIYYNDRNNLAFGPVLRVIASPERPLNDFETKLEAGLENTHSFNNAPSLLFSYL